MFVRDMHTVCEVRGTPSLLFGVPLFHNEKKHLVTKSATINIDRREYVVIVVVVCISYALKSSLAMYSHNGGYVFGSSVCHLANAPFFSLFRQHSTYFLPRNSRVHVFFMLRHVLDMFTGFALRDSELSISVHAN